MHNTKEYKLIKRKDKTIYYKTRQISLSLSLKGDHYIWLVYVVCTNSPKSHDHSVEDHFGECPFGTNRFIFLSFNVIQSIPM
jgi:hypothetical protein